MQLTAGGTRQLPFEMESVPRSNIRRVMAVHHAVERLNYELRSEVSRKRDEDHPGYFFAESKSRGAYCDADV